jgi:hypothetical protein
MDTCCSKQVILLPLRFAGNADGGSIDVYCYDMAMNAGISIADLYAWNPALGGDCSGLWDGYAYCIHLSTSSGTTTAPGTTTTPTTTPATTTTVTPPGPTQAGIIATCDTYVSQATGKAN